MEGEIRRAIDSGLDRLVLSDLPGLQSLPVVGALAGSGAGKQARGKALQQCLAWIISQGKGRDWEALSDLAGLSPGVKGADRRRRHEAAGRTLHPPDGYKDPRPLRRRKGKLAKRLLLELTDVEQDAAIAALTDSHAVGSALASNSEGYVLEDVDITVDLSKHQPETYEIRSIRALHDGIDRFQGILTLEGSTNPKVEITAREGAELREVSRAPDGSFVWVVGFPPVSSGRSHRFVVTRRLEHDALVAPEYIFRPRYAVSRFVVRIRFDTTALPNRVYRVDRVPRPLMEALLSDSDLLTPSPLGEVEAMFHHLDQGWVYGIVWSVPQR
jgi:hypothetical protein